MKATHDTSQVRTEKGRKAMRRTKKFLATGIAAGLIAGALAGTAAGAAQRTSAPLKGEGEGLKLVKNLPYDFGTDMEFATIGGRDILFAASAAPIKDGGGLHIVDTTNPAKPKEISRVKCSLYQGDVQVSWN